MEPLKEDPGRYAASVGLEVHAQLKTATKIFCSCRTTFGASPNSHTCPVCLGLPGALPVLNTQAVTFALRVGLVTHCRVARQSLFARKNYFYPDVPKNYQITQYDRPLGETGWLEITLGDRPRRISIARIHLEEDAGKLLHGVLHGVPHGASQDTPQVAGGGAHTRVDLNRAGVPLLEIVTAPELSSGEEASRFLTQLRQLLVYLDVCDGNLEEGSLRCDANVSVRPHDDAEEGTKIEVKNMNSFKAVRMAVDHEIDRQSALLADGRRIRQETRAWDADAGRTRFMRSKEFAHDYRYFPEPDLPPLVITEDELQVVRDSLPELPTARVARLQAEYDLPAYDAALLAEIPQLADYFEATAKHLGGGPATAKAASNWIMAEVLGVLKELGTNIEDFTVSAARLAELLALVREGTISGKIAKGVFAEMVATGRQAGDIVAAAGLQQTSDEETIAAVVAEVLDAHPTEVKAFLAGKERLLAFFMGEVMRRTAGRVNPRLTDALLREALDRRS